jgi:hypothetical protein
VSEKEYLRVLDAVVATIEVAFHRNRVLVRCNCGIKLTYGGSLGRVVVEMAVIQLRWSVNEIS